MLSQYGRWYDFCRDSGNRFSTIPVCNLFLESHTRLSTGFSGCDLVGIPLSNERRIANLGSILLSVIAIGVTIFLLWRSNLKRAAVGRREIQIFLIGYIIIKLCEVFSIGGFPLSGDVRIGFSSVHIGAVIATTWVLMLNGIVGYQLLEDGTSLSIALVLTSALIFFVGSAYIALDTGYTISGFWRSSVSAPNSAFALYSLYLLVPILFMLVFFLLEAHLVLRILGEKKPMVFLSVAALAFIIGQIFQFVASTHICYGTGGKINGGIFESIFTLISVIMTWVFWSSITEDDWPSQLESGYT